MARGPKDHQGKAAGESVTVAQRQSRLALLNAGLNLLALGLLAGVVAAGFMTMERVVLQMPLLQKTPVLQLRLPAWMRDPQLQPVRQLWLEETYAQDWLRPGDTVATPDLVFRLASDFAASPWVRRVVQVRKDLAGQVVVDVDIRRPQAVVKSGPEYYLVDADAVVLARVSASEADEIGLLRIYGVQDMAPQRGGVWPGRDLRAGLRLAALVQNEPFRPQLDTIIVANYGGRNDPRQPHLLLETRVARTSTGDIRHVSYSRGGVIRWGRAPGEEEGIENLAEQKILLLNAGYHKSNRVDMNSPYIDIRFDPSSVGIPDLNARQPIRG